MYYGPDYQYGLSKRRQGWDLGVLDAWGSERKVVTAGEADDGRNESPTATRHRRVRRMHGAVVRAAGLAGGGGHDKIRIMFGTEADQDPLRKYLQRRQRERVSEELAT
jgi:hypothetical protein